MIPILFCYFVQIFMFFLHSLQLVKKFETGEKILATIFYDLITTVWSTYDPSIAGVLLGNNSKKRWIHFNLSRLESFFLEKN